MSNAKAGVIFAVRAPDGDQTDSLKRSSLPARKPANDCQPAAGVRIGRSTVGPTHRSHQVSHTTARTQWLWLRSASMCLVCVAQLALGPISEGLRTPSASLADGVGWSLGEVGTHCGAGAPVVRVEQLPQGRGAEVSAVMPSVRTGGLACRTVSARSNTRRSGAME